PQDAEDVDHVLRRSEIALEPADGRILDLAEVQQRLGAKSEYKRGKVDRLLRSEVRALRRLRHRLARSLRGLGSGRLLGRLLDVARLALVGEPSTVGHAKAARRVLLFVHDSVPWSGATGDVWHATLPSATGPLHRPADRFRRRRPAHEHRRAARSCRRLFPEVVGAAWVSLAM